MCPVFLYACVGFIHLGYWVGLLSPFLLSAYLSMLSASVPIYIHVFSCIHMY